MSDTDAALMEVPGAEAAVAEITPAVEEVDAGVSGDENLIGETEQQPTEGADKIKTDARLLPKDLQRALKTLRDSGDPALSQVAKKLNDSYFREGAYSELGKIEDIKGLKSRFDELGGEEGISTLRARAETMEEFDRQAASGDPKVLEAIPDDGLKKLVSPSIDRLERVDKAAYADTMRPHLVRALDAARLPDYLNTIDYLLRRGDTEEATKQLGMIRGWIGEQRQAVDQAGKNLPDSRLQAVEQRERATQEREQKIIQQEVGREVVQPINSAIEKQMGDLFKGITLSDGQKRDFAQSVYDGVGAALRDDKEYQKRVTAAISSGDVGKVKQYVTSQVEQIVSRVARELRNNRYPNLTATPKSAADKGGAGKGKPAAGGDKGTPGVLTLPSKPKDEDIDWNKTATIKGGRMMALIQHRVYLKSGKLASWK